MSQQTKAEDFRALHEGEPFVIPNPWDAGSAKVLAGLGFKALATTSAGFAFTLGRLDGDVTLDEVMEHTAALTQATDLPVSVDMENGYGSDPEDAARGDHARRRGGRRRRLDRGLRPGGRHLRHRARDRAHRRGRRGGRGARLPVHAHGARREPHPRQPRPRRHDRAAAGLRARRRRRALRAAGCARPRRSAPSATRSPSR